MLTAGFIGTVIPMLSKGFGFDRATTAVPSEFRCRTFDRPRTSPLGGRPTRGLRSEVAAVTLCARET
jgi:hypothetical protein